MNALLSKLKGVGNIKGQILSESDFFNKRDSIPTRIPSLNLALSGALVDAGVITGSIVIAGPSRHFKSNIGLVLVEAYLAKYPEAMCLFYDSEFGITDDYLKNQGVDPDRVIHLPVMNIEELKFDMTQKLEAISKDDKVIIFIDSIGNLASKREADNALANNAAADMTRAAQVKSFFRIITPQLTAKDIPCISINHTYKTMEMFAKDVISGGSGVMLSANTAIIVGRQQEKDGTELTGYNFVLNIEKSRFIREKSKIPLEVSFDGGINPYSGLLDWALESGDVTKPKNGWYALVDRETGEVGKSVRKDATQTEEFLGAVLKRPEFVKFVTDKYRLAIKEKLEDDDIFEQGSSDFEGDE